MIDRKHVLRQLPTQLRLSSSSRLSSDSRPASESVRLSCESSRLSSDNSGLGRESGRVGKSREDSPMGGTGQRHSLGRDENDRRGENQSRKKGGFDKKPLQEMNVMNLKNMQGRQVQDQREYIKNQAKISRLRNKLEELFKHYQSQQNRLQMIKEHIEQSHSLSVQNETLSSQISKIRNMVKDALFVRQKSRLPVSRPVD